MIWGAPPSLTDNQFFNNVMELIKEGRNITHVLGFNEPDGPWSQGGSNMSVVAAALAWKQEIAPLQKLGIKAGAPSITQRGFSWLQEFAAPCSNCTFDFIPLHWYGNFSGLQNHINTVHTARVELLSKIVNEMKLIGRSYPNTKLWITEYAYDHVTLQQRQDFFNASASSFDTTDYIERYSYFGAMRSNVSHVGPNATMLTADGKLPSIGS